MVFRVALLLSIALCCVRLCADDRGGEVKAPRVRTFEFTYQVQVEGLTAGQKYRLWVPVPQVQAHQEVTRLAGGGAGRITQEGRFGNRMLYMEGVAEEKGVVANECCYRVTRREVAGEGGKPSTNEVEQFLKPDQLVPIEGKPLGLLSGKTLPERGLDRGRVLYDTVNSHMKYSKEGTGWGRGDANWACDSRYGNCSDFHSLFISLARGLRMPAKFEIGFSLPEARGSGEIAGYHCWAYFQPDNSKGWIPVDISEANKNPKMADYYFGNLTENRITMSTGRDLVLEPAQDGPPLNFFIYPYAEVDGKAVPMEKIKRVVKYRDVQQGG